ncbi:MULTISPECIES: LEM-3-like GIY-YIG domain-containing protein [Enterococcus]|uniref:GIY-YIG domain-containing protein n=1 Tax=Enterococcus sulfureus ATCC 49903 TaxID=1140003 RepID=S0PFR3_9ENTE|nr:hypothetical protein [Enterococcus sulfureus]EOT48601.1 hypothetical protein OMY_00556 [Enterococcus sulfureus ATCC 49903]EOT87493.1 hypothetical protein I573_00549 [Enterococcus sulfureus ATCC 49903]
MIEQFSHSTRAMLAEVKGQEYYVYLLVDPRTNQPFYIGKGKGNRVFAHKQAALTRLKEMDALDDEETKQTLKIQTINEILAADLTVSSYIVSYGLTQAQAFASENALINYIKLVQGIELTNIVNGHGTRAMLVEELEEQFGYQPLDLKEIATDELILAVKVKDAFQLSKDESKEYSIYAGSRDDMNLKSRTLGNWVIGKDKIDKIRYILAINTGADNAVVAAYEVSKEYSESEKQSNGLTRYAFQALSSREETLKKLAVYKRSLPQLTFGSGSSVCYINKNKR